MVYNQMIMDRKSNIPTSMWKVCSKPPSKPESHAAGGGDSGGLNGGTGGEGGEGTKGGAGGCLQTSHALHLHTGRSPQLYAGSFSHHDRQSS